MHPQHMRRQNEKHNLRGRRAVRPIQACPVQSCPMFAARPFCLNLASTTPVVAGVCAISTKTTTIKG